MTEKTFENMMTFDPFSNTIGYDRMFNRMNELFGEFNNFKPQKYPPYNILKKDDNTFEIEIAVAGFKEEEIEIMVDEGILTIKGSSKSDMDDSNYFHRGIASRDFIRKFSLSDTIEINGATMNHGLLTIELENVVPEHKKPKKISIGGSTNKEPEFLTED